jgi:hypothetical protein
MRRCQRAAHHGGQFVSPASAFRCSLRLWGLSMGWLRGNFAVFGRVCCTGPDCGRIASLWRGQCLSWVKNGSVRARAARPFYLMSVWCQDRSFVRGPRPLVNFDKPAGMRSLRRTDQTAGEPSVLQRRRTCEFFLGSTCLVQESLNSREELEPILLHANRVRAFRKHDVSLIGSVHKQRKQCLRHIGRQISIPFCLH